MSRNTQHLELEEQVEQLDTYSSTGTTLISYYIHHTTTLQTCIQKIQSEQSQAKNIKSKQTRKDVTKALSLVQTKLQSLSEIPETGVVIFTGVPENAESNISELIIPPYPIETSIYTCQDSFYTDPLTKQYTSTTQYGCVLLDTNAALIATINGTQITIHKTLTSLVPGKHSKGGQSQQRFERRRTEQLHEFYKDIAAAATQFISTDPTKIEGLLIGGPQHTRKEFVRNNYLHHTHQQQILYKNSVSTINKNGVQELLQKAEQTLQNAQITQENQIIERFMKNLRDDTAVYGIDETETAAEYGAIDTLLLSKQVVKKHNNLRTLEDQVTEYNGNIQYLECASEKGSQFNTVFTGIGAILRYPIN